MVKGIEPNVTVDEYGRQLIWSDRKTITENCFTLKGKPFSLEEYRPFHAIYLSTARKTVVQSGRQVAKSTTAANFITAECIGEAHWDAIAVLPSVMQMRRFSNQRVAKVISESDIIKKWFLNASCKRNTFERSFANGSTMYFGALSQIESLRGLSGNRIIEDEVQDMVGEALDIVEESLSGQSSDRQFIMRTGTAKTIGNVLDETFNASTGSEWIVVCPSGHHNVPSVDNIDPRGFICKKCRSVCDVASPENYWMAMNGLDMKWVGFRVPQIILPMHTNDEAKWGEIVHKRHNMDTGRFLNEVMGHPAGSGIDFLSKQDLVDCCADYDFIDYYNPNQERYQIRMATIDWGLTARRSFTVLSIWGLTASGRIKLVFAYRFQDNDLIRQIDRIAAWIKRWSVTLVGADWGAGVFQGVTLEQKIGMKVHMFQYVSEMADIARYDKESMLYKVNRTQAMSETFLKMKNGTFMFPHWKDVFEHYAKDILTIYMEPLDDNIGNDKFKFDHPEDKPDDFAHTCVYANILLYLLQNRKLYA